MILESRESESLAMSSEDLAMYSRENQSRADPYMHSAYGPQTLPDPEAGANVFSWNRIEATSLLAQPNERMSLSRLARNF